MWFKANLHKHEGVGKQCKAEEASNLINASQEHLLSGLPQESTQPHHWGGSPLLPLQTEGGNSCLQGHGIHYGIAGKNILGVWKTYYGLFRGGTKDGAKGGIKVIWGGANVEK